jgi:hypothetical protein
MVRYLPDSWQAGLTMNGKSNGCSAGRPFALRYRRVNGTSYEFFLLHPFQKYSPYYQETAHDERAALTKFKEPAMTSLIFFRSTGEAALLGLPSPALVILKGISRDKGF